MSESNGAVRLSQLIDTSRTKEGVWIQYQDTPFEVKVAYYGKPQMSRLFEEAKTTRINMRTLREEEEMDRMKFRRLYANAVIKDWKGLTISVLRKMVVVQIDSGLDEATEISCTPENKEMLLENSLEFDQWLSSMTQKVETFNERKREEELKN